MTMYLFCIHRFVVKFLMRNDIVRSMLKGVWMKTRVQSLFVFLESVVF